MARQPFAMKPKLPWQLQCLGTGPARPSCPRAAWPRRSGSTRWSLDSFWMLSSERARPSSSCLAAKI
eukprot:1275144-Heterocapsa_arctica.AAC.1